MSTLASFENHTGYPVNRSHRFALELTFFERLRRKAEILTPLLDRRRKRRSHQQVRKGFDDVERTTGLNFHELTNEMVDYLNFEAEKEARDYYNNQYPGRNPLEKNGKEKDLTIFFDRELSYIRCVQLVPWVEPNSRKLMAEIPIVGIHCPDLIIFGIGSTGKAATVIEVDGLIHDTEKGSKDALIDAYLREIGFDLIRIPASKVHKDRPDLATADFDRKLCTLLAEEMKRFKRSNKAKVNKFKYKIKLLNIATWLTVNQIDHVIKKQFGVELRLSDSLKIEFYRKNPHKWVKGAKRLLGIRSPILSNQINAKRLTRNVRDAESIHPPKRGS